MLSLRAAFLLSILCLPFSTSSYANTDNDPSSYDHYMRRLIELSKQNPQRPFAAMIIDNKTGNVLCEGVNASAHNPTLHGEIVAINNCVAKYPKLNWAETTLITDAEPCAMCTGAIIWAHISKIVYGTSIAFFEKQGFKPINVRADYIMNQAPFYHGTILGGVLHEETDKVFMQAYSSH
jgi:tRNA(adenine34) deaminase